MKNNNIISSFKYAFEGIFSSLKTERNLIIHTTIMMIVIILGLILKINKYEWFICIILFIIVISSELFNTALELVVDIASPDINPLAKKAKDISAGAVLITAIGSAIIGLWIFLPKIF